MHLDATNSAPLRTDRAATAATADARCAGEPRGLGELAASGEDRSGVVLDGGEAQPERDAELSRSGGATPSTDTVGEASRKTPDLGLLPASFRPLSAPPRKVLFFGKSRARTRATAGFVEAFEEHGTEVRWLNFGRLRRRVGRRLARLWCRRVLKSFAPDVVFAVHPDLPIELLREFRARIDADRLPSRIVQWCDLPLDDVGEKEVASFGASDLVFLVNPTLVPWFAERGVDQLVPTLESFSPTDHHPVEEGSLPERHDVVFIGGPGRTGARARFLFELAETHPVRIHGLGWERLRAGAPAGVTFAEEVRPSGYRRLCAESRIVLGDNQVNDAHRYFSNRTVLTLACAGFHLTRRVPGLEELYREGEHLAAFDDLDECRRQIDHYLGRHEQRRAIARAGCELVHGRDTFSQRLGELLPLLSNTTGASRPAAGTGSPGRRA